MDDKILNEYKNPTLDNIGSKLISVHQLELFLTFRPRADIIN